ncbi:MAG: DUF3098 domain-containing protein [Bacteroidetes bacterium]|nr:DUF3098 domain-containing protein [Bacteroidota bacterium]
MAKKIETKKTSQASGRHHQETEFPLSKQNYFLFGIGVGLMLLGFILMWGTTDIFDFRKLYIAPVVLLSGFVFNIYAIMKRPSAKVEESEKEV